MEIEMDRISKQTDKNLKLYEEESFESDDTHILDQFETENLAPFNNKTLEELP